MITSLWEVVTQARQPILELMVQVTLWSLLGTIVYLGLRRSRHSNRYVLLSFCLGTLALSLLILLPLRIWTPHWSWNNTAAVPKGAWTTQQITQLDSTVSLEQAPTLSMTKTSEPPASSLDWEAALMFLLLLIGAVVVLAVLRLLLGFLALEHWRRSSVAVEDAALLQLAAELQLALGVQKPVSLRITPSLGSPATIGWRKPTILLPASWTEWSQQERRAVLAHELAHVRQGDYPLWLLVQLAAAMHAYHPLVRWLVHRLQGELELAADTLAAPQAGGNTNYMRSLCRLALRHGSRGAGTLALALLPVHLPLSWRMMMLRSRTSPGQLPGMWSRVALACGLGVVVVLIAGLRGPVTAEEPKAGEVPKLANTNVVLIPYGSAKPDDHPNSQIVALQFHVVEIKRELLSKLNCKQDDLRKTEMFVSHDVSIEQINQRIDAKEIRVLASIKEKEFLVWSEVKSGIRITENQDGLLTVICTPLIKQNQSIQLKMNIDVASPVPNNTLELLGIPQVINQTISETQCEQNVCVVMPAWKKDNEVKSDKVLLAFVQASKVPEAQLGIDFPKVLKQTQPPAVPGKQQYEIEIHLVQTLPETIESFTKSDPKSIEGKLRSAFDMNESRKGAHAKELLEYVQRDVKSSTILACPKIITIEGQTAQIAMGEKGNEAIKISCDVKKLDEENKIQLTLQEELAQPTEDGKEKKAPLKQGVTIALEDGEYYFMASGPCKATPVARNDKVMVTIVRVRKVSMNPVPPRELK